jgi:tellurite methyltransferase
VVDWASYYAGTEGRLPRALLARALQLAPSPGFAVDLGSGSGLETLQLLERGWRVLSIDGEPAAGRRLRAMVHDEAAERLEIRTVKFQELEEAPDGRPCALRFHSRSEVDGLLPPWRSSR